MKFILALLLIVPTLAHALEVDEKLTVRIVKVSDSKKTVMLNRGTEDGLVEGDHAKFIVTAGIVARGVVVKVSPTRSVWSIYRLVNADFIVNDSVMSVKITPAVKITKDETQSLVQEDTPTKVSGDPAALGIPLADGAQDLSAADQNVSNTDLKALEENEVPASIVEKNLEVYGFLNISGLTSNTKTDVGDSSYNNSQSFHHIGLGGEFYPRREREWYSRFSVTGDISLMRENSQSYLGSSVENDITEFSFGASWHPTKLPSLANELIPFIHGAFHMGTVKSTFKAGDNNGITDGDANGSTSGFSVGGGYKFYTFKGLGFRAMVDYYMRSEKYKEDQVTQSSYNKKVAGPRFMMAISYRF